jgi:isoleucyl-tRNA synthetase
MAMTVYEPVEASLDLPALDRRVLDRWRAADTFRRQVVGREGGPEWVFYDGPPTANGRPHIGHAEARTFKDIYPRYRAMTGHHVIRKAGWDCHGLPVELEVEKEIGTRTKQDIEAYGIAEFNAKCRESVVRYVDDWKALVERIGHWIDMDDPYWTMATEYVESVWWSLKTLHGQGLLFEDFKSVAYCPRCQTGLSDAEVALGYETVVDPSVFVKFPVAEASTPEVEGAAILAWTTTPWTLPSNEGLAVDADETYDVAEADGERLVVASALREKVLGEGVGTVVATVPGSALVGTRYAPLFDTVRDGDVHRVIAGDFVVMNEGTGVVHIAPGYGADDLEIGRREGWPVFAPVDDAGRFTDDVPEYLRGRPVKETDADITEDLRARGLLLRDEPYEHTYPLCWRCRTPLLYMARTSWYVKTTAKKDRLLEVNAGVKWYPSHIRDGRYGDWLRNNVDWALSRSRYWGTPLPIWRCRTGHTTAIGSLFELGSLAGRDLADLDPHRPYIDEVTFGCPSCGEEATRVPEVIDTWYDSGAMPYAQWGYQPELGRGVEQFDSRFPADFIAEGLDQTRGWFYSLMAEATLLFDQTSYRNVVCHGLVMDREGRKMSKSLGNVIDPFSLLDAYGADAVRWFMLAGGSPWAARRASGEAISDVVRQFLLTLWNVYAFFVTYANADGFDPDASEPVAVADRPPLDRWLLSRLHRLCAEARRRMDAFDATGAARELAAFVDDLSNWYVRRARRRFWSTERAGAGSFADKAAAHQTLHEALVTVARLLAPFIPFVTEEIWRNLAAGRDGRPDSVHLTDYPAGDPSLVDGALEDAMAAARTIVTLGRTVRSDTKVKVRQPLSRAVVHFAGDHDALRPLLPLVVDELNVKSVEFAESAEQLAGWRARPNFRALGPRLGPRVKSLAAVLAADDGSVAARLAAGETASIDVDGESVELAPADVELSQDVREGWGVAAEGGMTVALDLELDDTLRREGLARELVRVIQDARKAAGLDVSDRIELWVDGPDDVRAALEDHRDVVATETLATSVSTGSVDEPHAHTAEASIEGGRVEVALRRARA